MGNCIIDTGGEILPIPPLSKEGTYKPPFVKGAAQRGGIFVGHCANLVWFGLEDEPDFCIPLTLALSHPGEGIFGRMTDKDAPFVSRQINDVFIRCRP